MWTYVIATGRVLDATQHPRFVGYSGAGHYQPEGRNNPEMTWAEGRGPIPVGRYTIGAPRPSDRLGPYVMNLDPAPGTDTKGRSLFRIHGNNAANDASHGCIILPPDARREIWESGDHALSVIAR